MVGGVGIGTLGRLFLESVPPMPSMSTSAPGPYLLGIMSGCGYKRKGLSRRSWQIA